MRHEFFDAVLTKKGRYVIANLKAAILTLNYLRPYYKQFNNNLLANIATIKSL
jgi:hypothetical protein